jgi:small subunit ribosomal protein S2
MADTADKTAVVGETEVVPAVTQETAPTNHQLIDLKEMLEAGCHFGHQARRWNPKMAKFIYTKRDGVHIIDLTLTAAQLELAMQKVEEWVKNGKEIVFVGTKRQAREIVLEEANQAGAPFIVERWLGGTLTNWEQMQGRINRLVDLKTKREAGDLKQYTKRERGLIDREIERLERFFGGIAGLKKKPEALFIIDTHKEKTAVYEAKISGVKIIGMVDTNGNPEEIEFEGGVVIPVNDDAVRSIKLVVHAIAEAYKAGKAARK